MSERHENSSGTLSLAKHGEGLRVTRLCVGDTFDMGPEESRRFLLAGLALLGDIPKGVRPEHWWDLLAQAVDIARHKAFPDDDLATWADRITDTLREAGHEQ